MHFTTTVDQIQLILNISEAQSSSARTGMVAMQKIKKNKNK